MNDVIFEENRIVIDNVCNFDLAQTLDCGQAFRWKQDEKGRWCGIAAGQFARLYAEKGKIIIENISEKDFNSFWRNYFDLERDYGKIIKEISSDEKIAAAAEMAGGIRILNQEPWEALCSFIISQNNNIPRIKGIIDRLCENFGEKIKGGYTFPTAEKLSKLEAEDLAVIRSGFRAKYIIDAAKKVAGGEIDLASLKNADTETAAAKLMTIKGVGPKVADCAMLYGLSHVEAFPKDVWIKRALEEYFNGSLPDCAKRYAGIAQQYIFYYIRQTS